MGWHRGLRLGRLLLIAFVKTFWWVGALLLLAASRGSRLW